MLAPGNDHPSPALTGSSSSTLMPHQPLLSAEKLKQLYAAMLKVRLLGERLHSRSTGSTSRTLFQEACEVGCAIHLRPQDTIAASADQHFVGLIRGLPPLASKASLGQRQSSGSQNERALLLNAFQNHDSAERLRFATGVAFAYRVEKKDNVVIAFSEEEGFAAAHASLQFAFDHRLPIIYVQQTIRAGNSTASRRIKKSHQLPVIPVDQSDVVAVYRVAYEAIDKARRGVGPTIIQCIQHLPQANHSRDAHRADPIEHMVWHLRKKNLWSDEFKRTIEEGFREELKPASATRKRRGSMGSNGNSAFISAPARHPL